MRVTLHRFGRKRRLVLMLEWLTLWPTRGPLAVSSQRRDISNILFHPRSAKPPAYLKRRARGSKSLSILRERRTYRGEVGMRQGFGRFLLPAEAATACCGRFSGPGNTTGTGHRASLPPGEWRFRKRSCSIKVLSIHIKGAIGGK